MVDPEHMKTLAQEPARAGASVERDAERMRVLSGLTGRASALSKPVAWSSALCTLLLEKALEEDAADAAQVCGACPIRRDCYSVGHLGGAPEAVRRWRDHMEQGDAPAAA